MTKEVEQPAAEPGPVDGQYKFEISFKILGNEIIGIKVAANTITNKWLLGGITTLLLLTAAFIFFGDAITGIAR